MVLGEAVRVEGFALAGADVIVAEDADAVCSAAASLPSDVAVVVLTPMAASVVADEADVVALPDRLLRVVMPP